MLVLGPEVDGRFVEWRGSPVALDLLGEVGEGLVDVLAALGAHLQEQHVVPFRHLPPLLLVHLPLVLQVALGGDQDLADGFGSVALDLLDPAGDVLEGLLVVDGIGQDDSGRPFVVGLRDVSEPLLASSVPDLELDLCIVDVDGLELEVHTDSGHVAVLEDAVAELGEEVGLSDPAVANDDDLGQKIVLVLLGHGM